MKCPECGATLKKKKTSPKCPECGALLKKKADVSLPAQSNAIESARISAEQAATQTQAPSLIEFQESIKAHCQNGARN